MRICSIRTLPASGSYFLSTIVAAVISYLTCLSGCYVEKGFFPTYIVNMSPATDQVGWDTTQTIYFLSGGRYLWVGTNSQARVVDSSGRVIREFSLLPDDPKRCVLLSVPLAQDGKTLIANFQVYSPCIDDPNKFCHSYQDITGWDIESGQKRFDRTSLPVTTYISADGSTMAVPYFLSASTYTSVVDIASNHELFQIPNAGPVMFLDNQAAIEGTSYLPHHNRYLLMTRLYGEPDEVWDIQTKSKIATVPSHYQNIPYAISPDGTMLLMHPLQDEPTKDELGPGELLWDLKNSKLLYTLVVDGEIDSATLVQIGSFSFDSGKVITFGGNWDTDRFTSAHIHIWDTATGRLFQTIDPPWYAYADYPSDLPNFAGFRPNRNDQVWTSTNHENIRFWDINYGKLTTTFLVHEGLNFSRAKTYFASLHSPYFSQDGAEMMTTTEYANQLVIWDLSGI